MTDPLQQLAACANVDSAFRQILAGKAPLTPEEEAAIRRSQAVQVAIDRDRLRFDVDHTQEGKHDTPWGQTIRPGQ